MLLLEKPEEKSRHFMGSLVCVPERHQPGIVPAYQVIDGQQRLTTLSILLCAVRDEATRLGSDTLAAEVEQTYLIQPFKQGRERYKVFPRLRDRGSYLALVDRNVAGASGRLSEAYCYLSQKLQAEQFSDAAERLRLLFTTLYTRVEFVLINLDGENPYKIFRSLNSLGWTSSRATSSATTFSWPYPSKNRTHSTTGSGYPWRDTSRPTTRRMASCSPPSFGIS